MYYLKNQQFEPFDIESLAGPTGIPYEPGPVHELLLQLVRGYRPSPNEIFDMGTLEQNQKVIGVLREKPKGGYHEFEDAVWEACKKVALKQVLLTNLAIEAPTLKCVLEGVKQEKDK